MIQALALATALGIGSHAIHPAPMLDLWPTGGTLGGVSRLIANSTLCINGTCVAPSFQMRGGDCTATSCPVTTYGTALPRVAVATQPSYATDTPMQGSGETTSGMAMAASDYFQESSASMSGFGTDDVIIEIVGQIGAMAATKTLFSTYTAGSNQGIEISATAAGTITAIIGDGSGSTTVTSTASSIGVRTWFHYMAIFDRSGSMSHYITGVVNNTGAVSARALSLTATNKLTVGAQPAGGQPWDGDVAYVAVWHSPAWLDTNVQDNLAYDRAQMVMGSYPRYARADWRRILGGGGGTSSTGCIVRKTTSNVTSLFRVGKNWKRLETLSDGTVGWLAEGAIGTSGNAISAVVEDVSGWVALGVGDTQTLNGLATPEHGISLADGNIGAVVVEQSHGFTKVATLTAATWVFSVHAKAGAKGWLYLSDNTISNATAYFNLATCASGTVGAGAAALTENLGNGWCRAAIRFTGTVAVHTLAMQTAEADGDVTFAGDGTTVDTWFWGMQAERSSHPTSLWRNIGSTSRGVSSGLSTYLASPPTNVTPLQGSMSIVDKVPAFVWTTADTFNSFVIVVRNSAGTAIQSIGPNSVTGVVEAKYGTDGSISGSTTVPDGVKHTYVLSWAPNDLRLFVDGVQEGSTDTSVDTTAIVPFRMPPGTDGDQFSRMTFTNKARH